MSHYLIEPSRVGGVASAPPSKSHTLRAVLFAALASGTSRIEAPLDSPDTEAMVDGCRQFGAEIEREDDVFYIRGVSGEIGERDRAIDVGNSGIALRFLTAIAALSKGKTLITGDHSIQNQRPMAPLIEALEQLGAGITTHGAPQMAPLTICGPIAGGSALLCGRDSQPVSALLIAGSLMRDGIDIRVNDPGERPWVELTLTWLKELGVDVQRRGYHHYSIAERGVWDGFSYRVGGDFSSAAFLMGAALVTRSAIEIDNLDMSDPQGDKAILEILAKMGGKIEVLAGERITIAPSELFGAVVDINHCIDAIAIISAIACYATGVTEITNAAIARCKESNRIAVLAHELKKMGAAIEEMPTGLRIEGGPLHGADLSSHSDHRIAMALAVAALGAKGPSRIDNVECVAKSYRDFPRVMRALGAELKLLP